MFFVINKEKVYAYIVSVFTIVILFFMSHVLNSDVSDTSQVSGNVEKTNMIETDTAITSGNSGENTITTDIESSTTNNTLETGIVPN